MQPRRTAIGTAGVAYVTQNFTVLNHRGVVACTDGTGADKYDGLLPGDVAALEAEVNAAAGLGIALGVAADARHKLLYLIVVHAVLVAPPL